MLFNDVIIAEKEEEANRLLREGTNEEIRGYIYETRFLAWKLQEITYKFLSAGNYYKPTEVYQPKHFK